MNNTFANNGVFVAPEVDLAKISSDAVIYPGCRILGEKTSIGPGCVLGAEAPLTLENCQLGRNVELKGGFISGAVFLDGSNLGSGAHVRAATLLEEEASGAHSVGLKQTVLLPFVALGSLINFCDILMSGGTDRKNHSEVGSSYIHFNYTPNQDKATASLVGDVPRGVLLNERPIFLGGQGGLVGPARIAYGSVIAAGSICRKDILKENHLYIAESMKERLVPFAPGYYGNEERIFANCLSYIGNIKALKAWYENIRVLFIRDEFDRAAYGGAINNLNLILEERLKRLKAVGVKSEFIGERVEKFLERKDASFCDKVDAALMNEIEQKDHSNYLEAVRSLSESARVKATAWLQSIVDIEKDFAN